ncbi:MAG: hypothetical protein KDD69_04165 [Bdellovibrionales bacterium]|nr:hypothetical protein [Bdellovibrionales bacterium]
MGTRLQKLRSFVLTLLLALVPAAAVLIGFELRRQYILLRTEQITRVDAMLSRQMTPALSALAATGHEQERLEEALRRASEQTAQLAGIEERYLERSGETQHKLTTANSQIEESVAALSEGMGILQTIRSAKGATKEQITLIDDLLQRWDARIQSMHQALAKNRGT